MNRAANGAAAGAIAAAVWAAQQPLDKRVFGCDYDDVELLGKLVTRGSGWRPIGLAMHLGNGAFFGAVESSVRDRLGLAALPAALAAAVAEHVGLWPMGRISDRFHPARRELPRLTGNRAAFAQATWRHLLFGAILGVVEGRFNPPRGS
ncbi:MAG: hypothetical protein ACR2OC_07160 [Solirubrobacterales bacterium]